MNVRRERGKSRLALRATIERAPPRLARDITLA